MGGVFETLGQAFNRTTLLIMIGSLILGYLIDRIGRKKREEEKQDR
jgi:MFS family permease